MCIICKQLMSLLAAGQQGFSYIRISLVRAFLEGLLGSPVPMLLVARTLNSYSTQGLKSVTVADSCFPPSSSGTERHHKKITFHQNPARSATESEPCWWCVIYCHYMCGIWKGCQSRSSLFFFFIYSINFTFTQPTHRLSDETSIPVVTACHPREKGVLAWMV